MKERQYCLEKGAPVIEQHAGILSLNVLLRHYRLMTVSKPHARASGVYRSARHRDLLSRFLAKWHNIPQGVSLSEEQQRLSWR